MDTKRYPFTLLAGLVFLISAGGRRPANLPLG